MEECVRKLSIGELNVNLSHTGWKLMRNGRK
jgi:hypothetical protein